MSRETKNFDYQLDLTPFISLLSVCICFLLLTVAWFQVGALSVKQAMGAKGQGIDKEDKLYLWIYMKTSREMEVQLKKGGRFLSQKIIKSSQKKELAKWLKELKKRRSKLSSAFIFPKEQTLYEDIVKTMDSLRQAGVFNIGISPL